MPDPHNCWRWKKPGGVSDLMRQKNPQCQWCDRWTNSQCTRPSEVVHHLKDWKDAPELFFEWSNLVAVCENHHSGGQRGDTQAYFYTNTIGPGDSVYPHSGGWPTWRPEYKPQTEEDLVFIYATRGGR